MAELNPTLSKLPYWLLQVVKKRRVKKEKEKERRQPIIMSDICPDVSVDIVLVTKKTGWKALTPIFYMTLLPDAFQEAFRDPKDDPWGLAEVSIWGTCKDPAKTVFKAVLKQTGEAIGFGSFIYANSASAQRRFDDGVLRLEQIKGTEGELLRWWYKEIGDLRDQHVAGKNYICELKISLYHVFFPTTLRLTSFTASLDRA